MAWFYSQPFFVMPGATVTLFITGFLFVRHRVFEDARAHHRLLGAMAAFGFVSWVFDTWVLPRDWSRPRSVADVYLRRRRAPAPRPRPDPHRATSPCRRGRPDGADQLPASNRDTGPSVSGYALGPGKYDPSSALQRRWPVSRPKPRSAPSGSNTFISDRPNGCGDLYVRPAASDATPFGLA